jgi:anthranilate synthase component 2
MRKKTRAKKILLVDNYDSFTYNLYDYFLQLGTACRVVRNDHLTLDGFKALDFEAIVLSPGPKKPEDAGLLMDILAAYHRRVPILGICLGHQAIGQYFGATLLRAPVPMHGKVSDVFHQGASLFSGISNPFQAMRYHSLIVQDFSGTSLVEIAATADQITMAIQHEHLPVWGVQFHPESIGTPAGMHILENWLALF